MGIVNNFVAFPAKVAVPLASIATLARPAALGTINKKETHSAMKSVATVKDSSLDAMMETRLMVMAAAAIAKSKLVSSVLEVLPVLPIFVQKPFQKPSL